MEVSSECDGEDGDLIILSYWFQTNTWCQPSLFAVVAAIFFYIENLIAKTYKGNNEDTKLE